MNIYVHGRGPRSNVYRDTINIIMPFFNTVPKPDVTNNIIVCNVDHDHYKTARQYLLEGKNVLLEKFPCEKRREFMDLANIAAVKGCRFAVGWTFLYHPMMDLLGHIKDRGKDDITFTWKKTFWLGGPKTAFQRFACHHIAMILQIFENKVVYQGHNQERNQVKFFLRSDCGMNITSQIQAISDNMKTEHFVNKTFTFEDYERGNSPVRQSIEDWLFETKPDVNTIDISLKIYDIREKVLNASG